MRQLAGLGVAILVLTLMALGLQLASGWPDDKPIFVLLLALAVVTYFFAARASLRAPPERLSLGLVLGIAAAMRIAVLLAPPALSTDVFRYVWDGRVQAASINPYRYVPADPALASLRDSAIYPNINRADTAPTIYPPAAQAIFAAIGRVAPTVLATKATMVGFEVLAVACLLRLLALARLPAQRVLIYAWNPLAVWSFASDGHVDAAAIGLLAAALLLRARLRDGWAGSVLGAAVLVKFLPMAIGPALWRRGGGWRLAAGFAVAVGVLYACYSGVGTKVFGYLAGYGGEEGLRDGSGFWPLAVVGSITDVPPLLTTIYVMAVAAGLLGLGIWIALRPRPTPGSSDDVIALCGEAAILAACVTMALTPHYPWYYVWLAAPCVVRPMRAVIWLSAAPVLLYATPLGDRFAWPALVFVPAIVLALMDYRSRPALAVVPA